jgi:hypothetical protein
MPSPARAAAAVASLRQHKAAIDDAIRKLSAYADTKQRVQTLTPRDELLRLIALGEALRPGEYYESREQQQPRPAA